MRNEYDFLIASGIQTIAKEASKSSKLIVLTSESGFLECSISANKASEDLAEIDS